MILLKDIINITFLSIQKTTKPQIDKPRHPSINQWYILPRIQMNALKQKWKLFGCWLINELRYLNMKKDSFDIIMIVFLIQKKARC